ncbi:MAG: shikimate dehydrogenase [Bacteroidetes bacterium]|nr:shikimate dehydrogenase [Bacteroidota bacterium]MCW5894473.1 shikimate dehydrogenase [Bacteroidota bacterium]
MIIVSITGPGMKDALAQIAASSPYADMFELRLDMIQEPPLGMLMGATDKPVIIACRPEWEGGKFRGTESERMELLDAAAELGAAYVDIELHAGAAAIRKLLGDGRRLILSNHSSGKFKFDIASLYKRMRSARAQVLKFAYTAEDSADMRYAIEFLQLAERDRQKAVAIAMGEFGEPTRILYKKFGAWATYASAGVGLKAASGQIPAAELKNLYRSERISGKTKVFGVVGNPLKQSKGVYLHNPLFQAEKKDAVYCRFPVKNLKSFINHIAPKLNGFSVTIPHKQAIMKYLDRTDPTATAIGAVNTVIRTSGKLYGTNTDAPGALDAIEKVVKVKGKAMLIAGAGGAARAIAFEAKQRGATVFFTNRTETTGRRLASEFNVNFISKTELLRAGRKGLEYDIIVNATPVGMTPYVNVSPLPKTILRKTIVFDAVYNPPMTKLLRDAKSAGAKIIQGTEMYFNQAALQFKLYAGVKPGISTMRQILE